jgi:hypothetical protein
MQKDFPSLPSYAEAVNPENASMYPVINCVPVSLFSSSYRAYVADEADRSNRVVWEFQSLSGAFKAFSVEISYMLEVAVKSGLLTFEIPERHWFFNLKEFTQISSLNVMHLCTSVSDICLMVSAAKMDKKHSETAVHLAQKRDKVKLYKNELQSQSHGRK